MAAYETSRMVCKFVRKAVEWRMETHPPPQQQAQRGSNGDSDADTAAADTAAAVAAEAVVED